MLTQDQTSIRLYRSCYIDSLEWGTWAPTQEWTLAWDTKVLEHVWFLPSSLLKNHQLLIPDTLHSLSPCRGDPTASLPPGALRSSSQQQQLRQQHHPESSLPANRQQLQGSHPPAAIGELPLNLEFILRMYRPYMYMYIHNMHVHMYWSAYMLITTVDRDIFAGKIFRLLNFHIV